MVLSKTPFRISFFGGGTDFPDWYKENGGAVISTTIDKYCHISLRELPPFFEYKHRLVYSQIELIKEINEIDHPSIREVFRYFGIKEGLEIHHDGDLPARSGLGSSSAFTVGLINCLKTYQNDLIRPLALAIIALHIEQDMIKEAVGSQDQIAAAYGGFNKITFNEDQSFLVKPIFMANQDLENSLCLFFTGISRLSTEIEADKIKNLPYRMKDLREMKDLVEEAEKVLNASNFSIKEFGNLLNAQWILKKRLSKKVTTDYIDDIYDRAMLHDANGGKILGAGGGGFILFCIDPENKARFVETMKPLIHVPFRFDPQGSRISHCSP